MRKESPAHWPLTLTTLNRIFRSKYSSVAPMCMPWPFKGGRPAAVMAVSRTFRNFECMRGVNVRNPILLHIITVTLSHTNLHFTHTVTLVHTQDHMSYACLGPCTDSVDTVYKTSSYQPVFLHLWNCHSSFSLAHFE